MCRFSYILKKLGEPSYQDDNCLIYNEDCIRGLKKLKTSIFDCCITSPPYNIGKEYESSLTVAEYVDWSTEWISEVSGKLKDNGSMWLNLGYMKTDRGNIPISYMLHERIPMYLQQEVVWHYTAGVACRNMFSPRNEKLLWYLKNPQDYTFNLDAVRDKNVKYPNQTRNGKLRCNPLGKNPGDVWIIPKVTSGRSSKERTKHPAQFPEALVERCVLVSTNERDIILDPFMGSGTTAKVALNHGRRVVGFEINSGYLDLIRDRLDGKN